MKKVKPGESLNIPAQTFNTFVDAAQDFLNRRQSTSQRPTQSFQQTGIVLVKNNSGADRGRFDVLGIDGPIFTPTDNLDTFKNTIALKGITPTAATHVGKFVILQEPVADGELGRAVISGVTPVLINVTVEGHKYADVADGETVLTSGASGAAQILWVESGTGIKWGIVKMGMPVAVIEHGKPTGDFTSGATITLAPCGVDGSEMAGATNVIVHLAADQSSVNIPFTTSDVVAFMRYPVPGAGDVVGVLAGLPPTTSVSVMTDWRWNSSTHVFEVKTRTIYVLAKGDESAWTDKGQGIECNDT